MMTASAVMAIDINAQYTQKLQVGKHSIDLQLPKGLKIEFLAAIDKPRLFVFAADNSLIIGSKSARIYRLFPPYRYAETLATIPSAQAVHSVAFRGDELFVADTCAIWKANYDSQRKPLFKKIVALPCQTGGHYTRTLITGPDQSLYVSIGISGNCSDEYLHNSYPFERRRGGIFLVTETPTSYALQPFSAGLRNPIGLAFSASGDLYATNAGPDNLGYELPPEVLVRTYQDAYHGMPWLQYFNGAFQDGRCASSPAPRPAAQAEKPVAWFAARSTPIGIDFLDSESLSKTLDGDALIAIHGSWAKPDGGGPASRRPPKILHLDFNDKQVRKVSDLVSGFQRPDGSRFARPAGILQGPDGDIYFSSDGGEVEGLFVIRRTD